MPTTPWAVDLATYDAAELRRLLCVPSAAYGGEELTVRDGAFPGGDAWKVTKAGSPVVCTVRRGVGVVPGPSGSGTGHIVALDADSQHTLTGAAVNPRIDIITVGVVGAGAAAVGQSVLTTGTPAASPSAPAVPTGHHLVATANIAASGAGGAVTLTDERRFTVARGGVLPFTGGQPGVDVYPGMVAVDLDSNEVLLRNAANDAWRSVWQPLTEVLLNHLPSWPKDVTAAQRACKAILDPARGHVTMQGRLLRANANAAWTGGQWNQITEALPASVRPVGGNEYGTLATSEGPAAWRFLASDNCLYGMRNADTTFVNGAGWISLGGVAYYI